MSTEPQRRPTRGTLATAARSSRAGLQRHHRPQDRRRAGMLAGSLYYHFDSKESMSTRSCRRSWRSSSASTTRFSPATTSPHQLERAVAGLLRGDRPAPRRGRDLPERPAYLLTFDRFAYLGDRNKQFEKAWLTLLQNGIAADVLRDDLDLELTYRFVRDTVWVAVSWYRPGGQRPRGDRPAVPLDGAGRDPRMTEAYIVEAVRTPVGKRGGALPASTPPTWPRTRSRRSSTAPASTRPPSTTSIFGCCDTIGPQAGDIARTAGWRPGCPRRCRA